MRGAVQDSIDEGNLFLVCVGTAVPQQRLGQVSTRDAEPFLHIPLSDANFSQEAYNSTFLLMTEQHEEDSVGTTTGPDPWEGRTVPMRTEFVEAFDCAGPT